MFIRGDQKLKIGNHIIVIIQRNLGGSDYNSTSEDYESDE
jgi:hypothetical protein